MKKNLLIASNNTADAKGIEAAFQQQEEIRLLPSVFTGRDTIDTIFAQDVDILILDLFMRDLDGISVLDFIGKLNEDRRPLVFVTTALADDRLLQIIKDRVIYCFTKPLNYDLVHLRVLDSSDCTSAKQRKRTRLWISLKARLPQAFVQSAFRRI